MRKTLHRVLACALAVALLVSCCISGLVLPVAAAGENLFPNGDMEGALTGAWEVADKATVNATAGFGGGKAWEVLAGKSTTLPAVTLTKPLEAGKKYIFRFKQSGGAGQIYLSSGTWADVPQTNKEYGFTSEVDGWNEVLVPFAVSSQTATLPTVYFYNKNTTGSVYYDEFAVFEYEKGLNLVPGADGAAFPVTMGTKAASLFGNFSGLTLAKDGENSVWKFAGLNTAGTTNYLKLSGVAKTIDVGEEMMLSFRYKGEGATASVSIANANNGDVSNAVTSAADANGWKTFTATVKVKKANEHNWALHLNFSGAAEVLVDDFFLGEEVKTSVNIAETAVEVGEGQTATLNTTVEPAGATIVWTSSDNTVATVANGVVTGVNAGTATITATVGNKSDTCEVTVTAAPTTYNGLFPNGSMDGALVGNTWESANSTVNATAGFGGGKAWEIKSGSKSLAGVTLKEPLQTGKWYMLRFKQSGGNGYLYFADSKYTNLSAVEVAVNSTGTAWNEVSALFQVTAETATLPTLYLYNKNTDSTSVYYDDFGVYEFAAGVNVIPGAGGALPITGNGTTTSLLGQFSNVTLDNGTWKFSGLETAGTAKRLLLGYLSKALVAGDELLVSFSYKGEGATAALTAVNANNGTISGAATSEADANGYKTYTATIKINNADSYNWGYNLSFSGAADVLVKDFSLSKVLKTSINITEETAEVEEGETVTLNATVEPTGTAITWTSSDDTVATVQNGVVTGVKAGTATITATIAGGKTDTCQVTVTAAVPVPPTYNGLFPNGNMDGTLVGADWTADATKTTVNATAGFGGGKAWEVFGGKNKSLSGVTLKEALQPGKWYIFRVKQTGGKGLIFYSGAQFANLTAVEMATSGTNGNWNEVSALFQVTAETATLPTIYFYNQNTDGNSVYYDDFAVYEYKEGVNLLPSSDGETFPITANGVAGSLLGQFTRIYLTDGAWEIGDLDAAGTSKRLLLSCLKKLLVAGDEVTVSFRYKGEGAVAKVESNSTAKAVVSNENTTEADADGFKTYTATVKFPSIDLDWALNLVFSGATTVLVDDFAITGKAPAEPEVDITQETASVEAGKTVTLGATTVPVGSAITWTSSDNTVATVADGVVTGVKAGTATITATIAGGKTDTCQVTVTAPPPPAPPATSIKLAKTTMHLAPGAFKTLQVVATPAGNFVGELTFTSNNTAVATVDENGKVTAVGNGEATITVQSNLGAALTDSCFVKVDAFGDIMIGGDFESDNDNYNWSNYTAAIGQVVVDPANAQNHVLSMNSKKSAWYRFDGLLKGNTIYRLRGKAKGDVKAQVLLNGVSKLISGQTRGEFYPIEAGDDVSQWKEFDVVFLTTKDVSSNYFIAFKNDGEGEVYFDDIRVEHVTLPVTSVVMNETAALGVGATLYLNYQYEPTYGDLSVMQWTSSDASVATVDNAGKVTALKEGKTTVTVKLSETASASCVVTVVKEAKTFALSKTELMLLPNGSATLYAKANPVGATIPGTLVWSSSDTAVATVDQNGNVTAVANGNATITCTNGTVTVTCAVTVSANGELIVGGDFENNTQNWGAVADGTNAAIADDPYEFGNKVLVVNPEKTTAAYANLALEANTLYRLTLRAKGAAATVNVNSAIVEKFFPADAALKTVADAVNWNTFTIRFRTKASGTLSDVLSFVGGKDSVTYIDDVSLVKLPTMTGIAWQYFEGDTLELTPENSAQLSVTPMPSDAYLEAPIVWSVADPSIATVDQNGKVTAMKEGNTTVTASVDGFAAITLKVKVDYYAPVFFDGNFENPNATWTPLRADMDFKGGITAGIGENGTSGFAVLGKHSTYYKGSALMLVPGNKYTLTVKYKSNINTHGAQYVWYEPLGQINFENTKGQWKTKTITGTIKASWYPNTYQMCIASTEIATEADGIVIDSIDVRMVDTGVDAEMVGISPAEKQLLPGEILTYILTTDPSNANTNFMTWTSSNEDVATVEFGKLYALGAGTTTITAKVPTANGGFKTATSVITVSGDEALIKNGTFDKAGDASWQLTGAAITAGVGFNKTSGAVLDNSGEVVAQALKNIKAGSMYALRFRHSGDSTRTMVVRVKEANGSKVYFEKTQTTSGAWNETNMEVVMPQEYDGADLVFEIVAAGNRGTVTVDSISLTEGFSKSDLIASDIVWNDGATQIKPGTPMNFTAVIGNVGVEDTKETQDIVVELRVNTKPIYTWTHKGGIKAGDFVALTTDADKPWIAEAGELVFSIHVNTTGTVRESNNKNNGIQAHVRVAEEFLEAPKEALNGGFNKLVFSDDFDFLHVDSEYTADYGYKWYLTDQTGVTGDMSDLIKTEDGVILAGKRMRYNWLLSTIDGETGAGWQGFTFGYLEYRSRFERTPNVETQTIKGAPAVWSFSHQTIAPHIFGDPGRQVEVDWMEYWGNKYQNGTWTVTLHDSVGDYNKQNMNNNPNHFVKGSYDENDIGDGEWHTVGYRWEKGLMICYLDGREIWRQEWGGPDGPNPPANVGAGEYRDDVFQFTDKQTLALLLAGGVQHPMELDYIRVWQSDGTVDAKPVLNSTFLEDHLTDENGEYFLEVTPDNYQAILDALFAWEELSDEQKDAVNNELKENGGKTYDELLFEAQEAYNTAEAFVAFYACDEFGDAYTAVDETNYAWILTAEEEWNALGELERAIVNDIAKELCGMTFDEMFAQAAAFGEDGGEGEEEIPSPEDGVPFPAVAVVGLFLGGAAMIVGKKRRDEE